MTRFALPFSIALCLLAAGPASASTIARSGEDIVISAAPGEANDIFIQHQGTHPVVTDKAGAIAGGGCEQVDAITVDCGAGFHGKAIVDLGDGDDKYQDGYTAKTDDVVAGPGNDYVYGDLGDDVIRGGDGKDKLEGGSGDDQIDGNAGNDSVIGHSGNDELYGGTGEDTISGDNTDLSNGDDVIEARDGEKDLVACGGGTDRVNADGVDVTEDFHCESVERDDEVPCTTCENTDTDPPGVSLDLPASLKLKAFLKKGLAFTATFDEPVGFAAGLFVPAKAARKWGLGRTAVLIAKGGGSTGAGTFPARLTDIRKRKKLRALLGRPGFERLPVVFEALAADDAGNEATATRKLKLTR